MSPPYRVPDAPVPPPLGAPPIAPLRPGEPPLAILIDYDGTIALTDVSDSITAAILSPELERELGVMYVSGVMGSREIMQREIDLLPPDRTAIDDIVAAQPHDQAFPAFVRRARAAQIPVEIVSDGFGFFILPAMERLGVADEVTIVSAQTTFEGGQPRIDFPNGHPTCLVCGTCKRNRVLAHQAAGRAVVFIGDGESDRYAAGYSDLVFAKRSLIGICAGYGWPYERWDQFSDIEAWLVRRLAAWAASGRTAPDNPVERIPHAFFCGPEVWGPGLTAPPEPFTIVGREAAPLLVTREPAAPARREGPGT